MMYLLYEVGLSTGVTGAEHAGTSMVQVTSRMSKRTANAATAIRREPSSQSQ
jgi:hypothetical protein